MSQVAVFAVKKKKNDVFALKKKRMNIFGREFICICEWTYICICVIECIECIECTECIECIDCIE